MNENQTWYYTDANGQQAGPVSSAEIQQLATNGTVTGQTMVWSEGMENWAPASQVEGLTLAAIPQPSVTAQPAAPVAQTTSPAANPYATPQTQVTAMASGDDYPVPPVKKASFGLYAVSCIVGTLLFIAGMVSNAVTAPTAGEVFYNERAIQQSSDTPVILISLGLAAFVVSGILRLIYTYRAWVVLQPATMVTTPGKAVGFLFIPLFNIYWVFIAYWKWSQEWNRITALYGNTHHAPRASEGMFLTSIILGLCCNLPLLGLLICIPALIIDLIVFNQMCKGVNFMHDLRISVPHKQQSGLSLY